MRDRFFTFFFALLISNTYGQTSTRILLHSGALEPAPNLESFISAPLPPETERVDGYYYHFIQFYSLPSTSQKQQLQKAGIILGDYIPYNTFMAALPIILDKNILRDLNIRAVIPQSPIQKIAGVLLSGVPDYARIEKGKADLRIQYQKNITAARAHELATEVGLVLHHQDLNRIITLRVEENAVEQLAALPWVFFIEPIAPPSTPDDTRGRSLHRSNSINQMDYLPGRHYDGSGTAAALADDGVVGPHIDFQGRLTNHTTNAPGGSHGDMTAGILAGAGNLNPSMAGMATGVQLHVFSITGYPQIVNAVTNHATLGTVVSSTSYSQGCNEYTSDTQFGDQTTRDNPHLLFVFSAGNNGSGNCQYGAGSGWGNITGGYKQGKNVLAVANLDAFEVRDNSSSRGPASDGRIKPDISANGREQNSTNTNNTYQVGGGTSAACPGIAGIACQLIQAYKELYNAPQAPTALIKACLLNSAEDLGNPGPDFTYGYGRVNALRALQTIEDNRFFRDTISQGITHTHTINVPANVAELRVMVYWHDEGGSPASSIALVNDLDMVITDPASVSWQPWVLDHTPNATSLNAPATRGPDHLNNMEQITISNPLPGSYTITIDGYSVPAGPQEYFIVYEFRTDQIIVTYPMGGEGLVPGEQELIRWDALKGIGTFSIHYSTNGGTTWTLIANNVSANTLHYLWTVPSTITGQARIRVSRGTVWGMSPNNFAIIGVPSNITVTWACPDSLRLEWTAVNGAAGYEISKLGPMYMDSIGMTTTNSFVVTGLNNVATGYWFSVRAVLPNGVKGRRANAIYKSPGMFSCPLQTDVELKQIKAPASGSIPACVINNPFNIKVEIKNSGINAVSNIPVSFQVNGGSVITETYTGTLTANQSVNYTFTASVNLNIPGSNTIKVWCAYPGDMNLLNDTAAHSSTVITGVVVNLPVTESFQGFTNCSTASDCEATNCNLSNGWRNATNLNEDDIDWRTHNGATPSSGTGPTTDHTLGTSAGKYIYLEASGSCFNKTALLFSPCINLTGTVYPQLSYWYHMYGAAMGSLSVDVMSNGEWNFNVVPTVSGNQGNQWLNGYFNLLPYVGQTIVIRFRGITGTNYTSDLALDDIDISESTLPPVANFTASASSGCIGKIVQFTDLSTHNPTSWNWSFNPPTVTFVNGTSATSQHPEVMFTMAGFYDVTLTVSNPYGSNSMMQPNAVIISSPVPVPIIEDFQSGVFPPSSWNVIAAGGSHTWQGINSITGYSGSLTSAAYVNNFNYNNPGAQDILETYEINLTGGVDPRMTFDVAYVRYSPVYSDTLRIDISPDCGQSWINGVYLKGGLTLATGPDQTSNFIPSSASQWRKDTVDLTPFIGNNIIIRFVNVNHYGNNLFIDNVNVYDIITGYMNPVAAHQPVTISPNPASGIIHLSLNKGMELLPARIDILDMGGRIVQSMPATGYHTQIDLRHISRGVYHLQVKTGKENYRYKVILY